MTKYTYNFRREDLTIVSGEIPANSYEEAFETARKLAQAVRPNINEDDIQVTTLLSVKLSSSKTLPPVQPDVLALLALACC